MNQSLPMNTPFDDEYAAKMALKSAAELQQYVTGWAQYREDAVLAALDELARRGQLPAEAAAIRAELSPVVEQQRQAAVAAREAAEPVTPAVAAETGIAEPALYSPVAIALFSFLFTFLAGGILFTINLFRLEEKSRAWRVLLFTIVYMGIIVYGLQTLGLDSQALSNQTRGFVVVANMVAVLAYLLYFWPRYIGERAYVSRSWLPALIVCLGILWVLFRLVVYVGQSIPAS